MNDLDKLVALLSLNRHYAIKICKELILRQSHQTLYDLEKLDITGEKLEILFDLCDFEHPYQYLIETVKFLKANYIDRGTMIDNLRSTNPVKFIHRLPKSQENIDVLYQSYTTQFYKNFRNNRDRFTTNKKK